jgi:nucleoside-diphosphate-sugar epimerase
MKNKIAIIGLGYVGLPLAVEFAKKYPTTGFDLSESRIEGLISGHDSTLEVDEGELKQVTQLSYTTVSESPLILGEGKGEKASPVNQVYNYVVGDRTSRNELYNLPLDGLTNNNQQPTADLVYCDFRVEDVMRSLADISKEKNMLKYAPQYRVGKDLKRSNDVVFRAECMSYIGKCFFSKLLVVMKYTLTNNYRHFAYFHRDFCL